MVMPDGYVFLKYDATRMVKGQLIAHFYKYEDGASAVEVGRVHCKPTKSGTKWIKYPEQSRPYSADLMLNDYLDLWCFVDDKEASPGTPPGTQPPGTQQPGTQQPDPQEE